jgi:hypothetical protein
MPREDQHADGSVERRDMAFLQKPFTIDKLSLKVREVLDRPAPAP